MNEIAESKAKISVTEIETEVRVAKASEYNEWQNKIELSEHKVAFLKRLIDSYKNWQDVLITISHNMRSEMRSLMVENDLDTPNKVTTRKIR
jgi:hypothetical protein